MKTITFTDAEVDMLLLVIRIYSQGDGSQKITDLYYKINRTPLDPTAICDWVPPTPKEEERPIGPGPDNYGEDSKEGLL